MWPKDQYRELISFYGNPDPDGDGVANSAWERENLVVVKPPFQMVLAWDTNKPLKGIRIHKKCASSLESILNDIWNASGKDQQEIQSRRIQLFGGSYSFRRARGLARLSTHSFGCAIDLDPVNNSLGKKYNPHNGMMHESVVKAFTSHGWTWGGRWKRPDAMHFQAADI